MGGMGLGGESLAHGGWGLTPRPSPREEKGEDALTPGPSPTRRGEKTALTPGPSPTRRGENFGWGGHLRSFWDVLYLGVGWMASLLSGLAPWICPCVCHSQIGSWAGGRWFERYWSGPSPPAPLLRGEGRIWLLGLSVWGFGACFYGDRVQPWVAKGGWGSLGAIYAMGVALFGLDGGENLAYGRS